MNRFFRVFIPKSVIALIVLDALVILACFAAAAYISFGDVIELYLWYENGLVTIGAAAGIVLLGLYFHNLYAELRVRSITLLFQQVLIVLGVVLITQALFAYVDAELVVSRRVMLISTGLILAVFPPWRRLYAKFLYRGFGTERLLFLGTDLTGVEIAQKLAEKPELGFSGLGFVDDRSQSDTTLANVHVLGSLAHLSEIIAATHPNRIIVNLAERRQVLPVDLLLDLRFSGIRIEEAANLYETTFGRITTRRLRPSQLIYSAELGPRPWNLRAQTVYSFVIAMVGLIIAGTILLLFAIAVSLTSPGPVFFRQKRVGLNGKHFVIYKFRSMRVDAEAGTGAIWAKRNDPRVTGIGGFLRKTRLDELPQLLNVISGKMAIVGPRPERPEFVNVLTEQIPFYRQRHAVKPGITGWAQINYKYGDTIEDTIVKLEYDLYYIKNLSPALDMFIMFHTAKVMLFSSHGQ
jgi:exopolysaccharide biosynthesis polyprenyl glycosylphosphotransferase